jgi:hypothetical protein
MALKILTITIVLFLSALVLSAGLVAAQQSQATTTTKEPKTMPTTQPTGGFTKIIPHGMVLHQPATQPEGTKFPTVYITGMCFQLDRTHAMLSAGIEEQGGADLVVGGDAFVFEKLSDIKPEKAIPIIRTEVDYQLKSAPGKGYLAKGFTNGGFVPLGALLPDGQPHPAAGTGVLVATCIAYDAERKDPIHAPATQTEIVWSGWETFLEVLQVRWDGNALTITGRKQIDDILGHPDPAIGFSSFCPQDRGFIAPFNFRGSGGEGAENRVVRFDWDGKEWAPSAIGNTFNITKGESEPCLHRQGGRYLISTRGEDPKGRMYASQDGLNYTFLFDWKNHTVPRILNRGLDDSLYLATNTGPGFLRNPLLAFPMIGEGFGEPVVVHDQDGVRNDKGDKIPFVDHAISANLHFDGKWRHLLVYRVCDLKERTLYGFQKNLIQKFQGDKGPIPLRPTSGLYIAEMKYDKVTSPPFEFAGENK